MEKQLIEFAAPVLAGLKTAALFSTCNKDKIEFNKEFNKIKDKLAKKEISVDVLKNGDSRALIYVYRKDILENDLNQNVVKTFLNKHGYDYIKAEEAISFLKKRIKNCGKFPHEIGLFLGYPYEDVIGFIKNKGKNSKTVGCWKVYGDEKKAQRLFTQFEKCRKVYSRLWQSGKKIEELMVG